MVRQQVLQCHSRLHWNSWQGHKERHEKKRSSCSKILQPSITTSSRSVHLCTGSPKYCGPQCHPASNCLASVPTSTYRVTFNYPATAPACNCLATVPASSFTVIATYASILPASTYPAAPPVCTHSVSSHTSFQPFAVSKASPTSHSTVHIFRPVTTACFGGFGLAKTASSSYCNTQRKLSQIVAQS